MRTSVAKVRKFGIFEGPARYTLYGRQFLVYEQKKGSYTPP